MPVPPSSQQSACATQRSPRTPSHGGPRKKILVVDDHPSVREALRLLLESCGYDCVSVADGTEALTQLRAGRFDVIVTDYEMPNMNGLELLESLASGQTLPLQPVILHTGNRTEVLVKRAMSAGACDVLPKPAGPQEVIAALEHAMRGR